MKVILHVGFSTKGVMIARIFVNIFTWDWFAASGKLPLSIFYYIIKLECILLPSYSYVSAVCDFRLWTAEFCNGLGRNMLEFGPSLSFFLFWRWVNLTMMALNFIYVQSFYFVYDSLSPYFSPSWLMIRVCLNWDSYLSAMVWWCIALILVHNVWMLKARFCYELTEWPHL